MKKAILIRTETGDLGTYGILTSPSGFQCYTLELPWKDNKQDVSCIPPGVYVCSWKDSPKNGKCYHVLDVPGRMDVQIHAANWAGDTEKGHHSELLGCIAPGRAIMDIVPPKTGIKQKGVSSSKDALAALVAEFEKENFLLTVGWAEGVKPEAI